MGRRRIPEGHLKLARKQAGEISRLFHMSNSQEFSFQELLDLFKDVKITFSQHCHSGIANYKSPDHVCGCWRCRKARNEEWTIETETQARMDSEEARRNFLKTIQK